MYGVALLTSTLLAFVGARIYERCELAHDLHKLGIRKEQIATWVCIAYHESRYDTAARNGYSGDHGLLQISEIYWCGAGKVCGLPCSALRDDDIFDDVQCALRIYEEHTRLQGNGFLAWVVYPQHCKQNTKKYLADCDFSVKDSANKTEERARSFHLYSSYPTVDVTLSKAVQGVSYLKSDLSLPPYLTVMSLLRQKIEQDFQPNNSYKHGINWSRFKIENVDDLRLPNLNQIPNYDFLDTITTQISTTSTTTVNPEPQYKPVKPWRTIETNQFRRRMMVSEKIFSEEFVNKPKNVNLLVTTSPQPTTLIIPSTTVNTFAKTHNKTNETCCLAVTTSTPPFSTQVLPPLTSTNILNSSNYDKSILTKELPKLKSSELPQYTIKTNMRTNNSWTTILPNLKEWNRTPSQKAVQIFTTAKPNEVTSKSTIKQKFAIPTLLQTVTSRPLTTTQEIAQTSNQFTTTRIDLTTKIKEMFTTTSPKRNWKNNIRYTSQNPHLLELTTVKPTLTNWRTTKSWFIHLPQHNQNHSINKSLNSEFSTEKSTWRRPKSWSSVSENITSFDKVVTIKPSVTLATTTAKTPISTTTQFYNRGARVSDTQENSRDIMLRTTQIFNRLPTQSLPKTTPTPNLNEKPTTERTSVVATPATAKTTISIFDLYLNPTKRPKPTYKFAFPNNSVAKFHIFSDGTTHAPKLNNVSRNTNRSYTSEVQSQIKTPVSTT